MVITSSKPEAITSLISALANAFLVKDLGRLSYFLGLEIDYSISGIILSQRKYTNDLLVRSNMLHAKPMSSPMAASLKLSQFDAPEFSDLTLFISIVGGLQYFSMTRPDLAFAVNKHLISWSSKKQKTVARSRTEAEYKSLASTAAELIRLQAML
ncbi:uncharacterized mitochondrial protein AtMg00810-like [Juglans regia]|uniref:Uncharacterized mitochondrial protein AtMg00810-like n=2 Tax=Juglans regia TaxID=51240 RepID=A0A6P9EV94_JUGRE|nr:uncharacterized mitochondrial protein AtMg00810-like [Juglans regia]